MKNKYIRRVFLLLAIVIVTTEFGLFVTITSKYTFNFYLDNFFYIHQHISKYILYCFVIGLIVDVLSGGFKKNTSSHLIKVNGQEYIGFLELYDGVEGILLEERKIILPNQEVVKVMGVDKIDVLTRYSLMTEQIAKLKGTDLLNRYKGKNVYYELAYYVI